MNHLVLPHIYVMRKRFHTLLHLTSPHQHQQYTHTPQARGSSIPAHHLHSLLPAAQPSPLLSSAAALVRAAAAQVVVAIASCWLISLVLRADGRSIGMAGGLPPGYRFYPTEEELISFYLRNKLDNLRDDIERVIPVIDVYSVDPWQLPGIHDMLRGGGGGGGAGEGEPWFYFCPRQEREARGGRPSRTTPSGYWKAAGTPGVVYSTADHDRRAIGMKKTMVFYRGRAPSGTKTRWKMNEYRALQYEAPGPGPAAVGVVGVRTDGSSSSSSAHHHAAAAVPVPPPPNVAPQPQLRSEFSLCRLYTKSGSLRQFDRRPLAAAGGVVAVPGEDPAGPSTAVAASPPDDDDGSGSSMQQQQLTEERGANDPYGDDVVTTEREDAHDPFGDDVAILDALLYWPGD